MESSHDVADLGDTVSLTGLQVSLCMVYCCAISAIVTTRPWGWWGWCFVVDRAKTIGALYYRHPALYARRLRSSFDQASSS